MTVSHQPLKIVALVGPSAGNALVCINVYEFPITMGLYELGKVFYLCRKGIELVVRVTAHTGISTNPDFLLLWFYGMKKAQRDKSTFAPGLYSKTPQKESAA